MPDFKFNCPNCGQSLAVPEEMLGQTLDCPACSQPLTLEADADAPPAAAAVCTACGAAMQADAVLCLSCGFHKGLGRKISTDLA